MILKHFTDMESIEVTANATEIKSGDSVRISCKVVGEPNVFVYQWRKDGKILITEKSKDLLIQGVTKTETGFYECFAANESNLSSGISIVVFGEFKFLFFLTIHLMT